MRFFISAGEPSGDLHGANLAHAIRTLDPSAHIYGLGGARMRSAGVELLYPLADRAVMGFINVVQCVPELCELLDRITGIWARRRPDAVVLIDYPGFHWHVAKRAKALDLKVVSFVPPQIWAWASHRVRRVRRYFDEVLCALPFEEKWFRDRGVANAHFVGHPYFDELATRKVDAAFVAAHRGSSPSLVALLPGSREREVRHNLPVLLDAARRIGQHRPESRFLVACFREDHRSIVESMLAGYPVRAQTFVGRTPEIIALADACIAVSGSVGLELLFHRVPTVVVYRTSNFYSLLTSVFKNVPFISLVNLLAERELYPEYLVTDDDGSALAKHIVHWLNDAAARNHVCRELATLCDRVAQSGACARAANRLVNGLMLPNRRAA